MAPGGPVDRDTVYRGTVYGDTVYRDTARFTLSTVLRYLFEYVGDPADLAESNDWPWPRCRGRRDTGDRASCLVDLGVRLVLVAGRTLAAGRGYRPDPAGDQRMAGRRRGRLSSRTDLAIALLTRDEETHDLADLDEAISSAYDRRRTVRRADPARHGNDLARLGIAEQVRYGTPGRPPTWTTPSSTAVRHRADTGRGPAAGQLPVQPRAGPAAALRRAGQAADLDEAVQAGDGRWPRSRPATRTGGWRCPTPASPTGCDPS